MPLKPIALAILAAAVLPAMAQTAASASPEALRRAQVLADLDMWHAAGMTYVAGQGELGQAVDTPEYRQYLSLRGSRQYAAAVQAHLGQATVASQTAEAVASEVAQ